MHQYVAAYGTRKNPLSYYYVTSAMLGKWRSQGQYSDYTLELTDGKEGEIRLVTPQGEEVYSYEECLQYGTLAIVFPNHAPKWTVVLNQDCSFEEGSESVKKGGTLTLCGVSMKKTAPVTLEK